MPTMRFRCSDEDRVVLGARAAAAGMTFSEWARGWLVISNGPPPKNPEVKEEGFPDKEQRHIIREVSEGLTEMEQRRRKRIHDEKDTGDRTLDDIIPIGKPEGPPRGQPLTIRGKKI